MYKEKRIALIAPAFNEEVKIVEVVRRAKSAPLDEIFVVDDGSTDNTAAAARAEGATVLQMGECMGVGAALRRGLQHAKENGFDIAVIIAGNNKDNPAEIPQLLDPIIESAHDLVVGSRFLEGGQYGGDMPAYRKFATRLHPFLISLFCRKHITESTNGFRALNLAVLDNPAIDLCQPWLDGYELEVYLLMRCLQENLKTCEVPCSKIYPPKKIGNTKMRPFVDWWNILAPVFLIGLRLRR
jgi:dolichol-phosphate mannosyltransferase